ncbi:DUF2336 domain-containing protein [Asticcacaulis sp. YBE204]|uniref:DUF2336 domain-containing protein n=1 Tax=Asticcacaulis sp. YBE204 TaxID=1282363 RepID=UPI0003C3E78A|nr:DUF2336 domain-containing protein [Asticcacaulis sp. YBE204]ESQ78025.1 hypothetical protein AEYBE204_16135 [Asticcacaulis sp. YBE204]
MLSRRPTPALSAAVSAKVEVRAPEVVRPSTLQPLTQVRTLLRLMQLNVAARQMVRDEGQAAAPEARHLAVRLGELIVALPPADQVPILTELSRADWADPVLIAALCRLPVDVSAGLILHTPVLGAEALNALITEGIEDKVILVARRRMLMPEVIDTLIGLNAAAVGLALLNNRDADLSEHHLDRLCHAARDRIALRAALVRHPALPRRLAAVLLGFTGPRLRDELNARFAELYAIDFHAPPPMDKGQTLHRLQQGDFGGFCAGLARATGFDIAVIRRALDDASAVPLTLMLVLAGIDRAAYPAVLTRLQAVNEGKPHSMTAHAPFVRSIFDLSRNEARARLTAILAVPA